MACNSKTAGRRIIWSKIWDFQVVVIFIWGSVDLLLFNIVLGSFGAIVSIWHRTRKRLLEERNVVKYLDSGGSCNIYMGYRLGTFWCPMSFWDYSVYHSQNSMQVENSWRCRKMSDSEIIVDHIGVPLTF